MNKFDQYLKTADKNQKLMVFAIFVIAVGFLLYYFVTPMLERNEELTNSTEKMRLSLSKSGINRLKKQLASSNKKLLVEKEKLEVQKENSDYLMSNVYNIKYIFFNDARWANTLDDILKYSVEKNIKIDLLKNSNVTDNSKNIIKVKKSIEIKGTGRYSDIVSLVQYIENFETLLKFNSIDMTLAKEKVKFSFELSVYGVGL